jgi:hypothetical protein
MVRRGLARLAVRSPYDGRVVGEVGLDGPERAELLVARAMALHASRAVGADPLPVHARVAILGKVCLWLPLAAWPTVALTVLGRVVVGCLAGRSDGRGPRCTDRDGGR